MKTVTTEWRMTSEEFLALLREEECISRARWPTINDMPKWHPARKLRDQIEADIMAELSGRPSSP